MDDKIALNRPPPEIRVCYDCETLTDDYRMESRMIDWDYYADVPVHRDRRICYESQRERAQMKNEQERSYGRGR